VAVSGDPPVEPLDVVGVVPGVELVPVGVVGVDVVPVGVVVVGVVPGVVGVVGVAVGVVAVPERLTAPPHVAVVPVFVTKMSVTTSITPAGTVNAVTAVVPAGTARVISTMFCMVPVVGVVPGTLALGVVVVGVVPSVTVGVVGVVVVGVIVVGVVVVAGGGGITLLAGGTPDSDVPVVCAASWFTANAPAVSVTNSTMTRLMFMWRAPLG
jgi:hypothetical protein